MPRPTSYKLPFLHSSAFVYHFLSLRLHFPLFIDCLFNYFAFSRRSAEREVLFWRPVCFSFFLSSSLCSVRSIFPSPSFHPPVRFFPPSMSLISSRCVSCIPLVRVEGEGSLKRRRRGEKHGGRGVRASGREMHLKRATLKEDTLVMLTLRRESPLSCVCLHVSVSACMSVRLQFGCLGLLSLR